MHVPDANAARRQREVSRLGEALCDRALAQRAAALLERFLDALFRLVDGLSVPGLLRGRRL